MGSLPSSFEDLMMAQQPIFDLNNKTFAYELLFRSSDESMANVINGENATSQVLVNLCIGITELEVQMRAPFFINITRDLLISDAFFPINPKLVYIEILEDQKITQEFINSVSKWHQEGYKFALDDYNFDHNYDALLPFTCIIKIDVMVIDPIQYQEEIKLLISQGYILLAEKVESRQMYDVCKELGFVLFQGFYLKRPDIIKGKRISSQLNNALELARELEDKEISISKVTALIRKNPTISYQILRLLNSPLCGVQRKVTDLNEAVIFLGLEQIKKWAFLITITSCTKKANDELKIVLIRAKCCENLALLHKADSPDRDFMAGIMSGIDILFKIEKKIAFEQISIDSIIVNAVNHYDGEIGNRLKQVNAYEELNWAYLQTLTSGERQELSTSFNEAMIWTNDVINLI